ncbi:MAG: 50S ribosomal protein L24 [Thaumarchaeota archaeon]|nr:50S ribosomal protein L24 [Nitrososphaerota archaeon]
MKPTTVRHRMIYIAPMHLASKQLAAPLSDELQEKYRQNSARVVEGDSVKVLRGEFKGIEGKVTNVSKLRRGVAIEGIKREKLKGGNVDIYIHPSKVMITALNLDDKWRQSRLEGQKPGTVKQKPAEEPREAAKPKEQPKESVPKEQKQKEQSEEQKPKQKETKAAEKTQKTEKKSPKTKKSDK